MELELCLLLCLIFSSPRFSAALSWLSSRPPVTAILASSLFAFLCSSHLICQRLLFLSSPDVLRVFQVRFAMSQGLVLTSFLCSLHRLSPGDLRWNQARLSAWVQMSSRSRSPAHISLFSPDLFQHPVLHPHPTILYCMFFFLFFCNTLLHKYMSY